MKAQDAFRLLDAAAGFRLLCLALGTLALTAGPALGQAQPAPTAPAPAATASTPASSPGHLVAGPPAPSKDTPAAESVPAGVPSAAALPPGVVVPPGASVAQPAPTEAQQRLQKLMAVRIDRSPAGALQAMAKPIDPAADEPTKLAADLAAGRWEAVGQLLSSLDVKDAQALHKHIVQQLLGGGGGGGGGEQFPNGAPQPMPVRGGGSGPGGAAMLLPQDVLSLADACPGELEDEHVQLIGQLLGGTVARGSAIESLLTRLEVGTRHFGGPEAPKRARAADLLFAASKPVEAGKFLPPADAAVAAKDFKSIDAHARHQAAIASHPQTPGQPGAAEAAKAALAEAWELTQFVLADKAAPPKLRDAAMQRSLQLLPQLTKELGADWLKDSFARHPARGRAVIANVGTSVAQNFMQHDVEKRRRDLEQQRHVAGELLRVAGADTQPWAPALNIMAVSWLQEADYTKARPPQNPQRFNQGGMYFNQYGQQVYDQGLMGNRDEPPAVPAAQVLAGAPDDAWLSVLDPTLAPRVRAAVAELHMQTDEIEKALPVLETISAKQPELAVQLANSMLGAWARDHDPNQQANQGYDPYAYGMYNPYGMMQQSPNAIPLTRAAQVRNLAELNELLKRLRKLTEGKLDDNAVVNAFTSAHSQAEVFRAEDMRAVFGPLEAVPASTLSPLLQTMRQRLARDWRQPQVQQQAKTKRTDKEVQAEVARGYEMLASMLDKRLAKEPDWRLFTALGAVLFDWAEFDYGREVELAVYTAKRDRAFEAFKKASGLYAAAVPKLDEREQTPQVYQQWFNAALGASDLAYLTRQAQPSATAIEQVRQALFAVSQDKQVLERHVDAFGKGLSDAATSLQPQLKPRYLRAGLQIVGDHPSAAAARKLVKYYDDLLGEVALHVEVDGPPEVGHGKPFGAFVSIRHTVAVGRESGGFNKYLQNQQSSQSGYYYQPQYPGSRGPKNYRDDFEKRIREALLEGFDIASITYHDDKVEPRGYGRPGWRETPLAYLLLKAKDASVDKLPPMQLDMDFSDRQGSVILPVSSQILLIDAKPANPSARPIVKLSITQTLDEREARNGKLILDIKATGHGLIPELPELLDTKFAGFKADKIDDQGLSVTKVDTEGDAVAPVCDRSWLIHLTADPSAGAGPGGKFIFPTAKADGIEQVYKRYADADVVDAGPEITLTALPARRSTGWVWAAVLVLAAGVVALILWRGRHGAAPAREPAAYRLPASVTAFTVLDLLRRMYRDDRARLTPAHRAELGGTIESLEQTYFARSANGHAAPDLARLAEQWVGRAS